MKVLFVFLLFGSIFSLHCQVNKYDFKETDFKNGSREQIIKLKKDGTPVNGIVEFTNGELKCENGKIILETMYYKNGNINYRFELKNGQQHGKQEFYHKNGNKKQVFFMDSENPAYKNGKESRNKAQYIIGQNLVYYKNGQLMFEENSNEQGMLDGVKKVYYKNGILKFEENYDNGLLTNGKYFDKKGIEIKPKS